LTIDEGGPRTGEERAAWELESAVADMYTIILGTEKPVAFG
jgi:hypothetical protein